MLMSGYSTFMLLRTFHPRYPRPIDIMREKHQRYDQQVREIERASFVPFVMACTRGIGPSANVFLKRLGALLAEKHNTEYSLVMGLLRCRLNFAYMEHDLCAATTQPLMSAAPTWLSWRATLPFPRLLAFTPLIIILLYI